ncbi:MAG: alpha/beta hydrolase [Actinomycetota bacterium]|nr:alpha/beta hydrolase [Actinomycetota bacterium]
MNVPTEIREVRGHAVRVLRRGTGHPVVVLHGWGGRIESMWPAINCLGSGLDVVAIDLPGFGESPTPQGVWGTADYAQFVVDVLEELQIEKAHFLGHSFGAKTSLYVAATQDRFVDKLVVVGSSGLTSPPSAKVRAKRVVSKTARAAGKLGAPGERVRKAVYKRIASQDYRDAGPMRPIMVKVVNEDIGYLLNRVRASTLLVWGSEDDAVPLAHARTMESLIPDAGLVVFEGAGHFAYLDDPDRFCAVVRHFFGVS